MAPRSGQIRPAWGRRQCIAFLKITPLLISPRDDEQGFGHTDLADG
ncbi:hypothetical protein ACFQAT_11645 [Undibacterium arcticum]|uniref:Uncharacterized protein n=1 Tax=Undibacterium arcticum TaxID=1762892 RepID=A0ABV7F2S5_9BURK